MTEHLGDPYEHPGSELWELRRTQRALLRALPADVARAVEEQVPPADLTDLDAGRSELLVRKRASVMLDDASELVEQMVLTTQRRLQYDIRARVYDVNDVHTHYIDSFTGPEPSDFGDLEHEVSDRLGDRNQQGLWDALFLCVLADRISIDGDAAPVSRAADSRG
jgi:hypothetical protein